MKSNYENSFQREIDGERTSGQYLSASSSSKGGEGELAMIIWDEMMGWVNKRDRETIPRSAFLEIGKAAAPKINSSEDAGGEKEDELWDDAEEIFDKHTSPTGGGYEADYTDKNGFFSTMKSKYTIRKKDLVASVQQDSIDIGDAPFKDINSIGQMKPIKYYQLLPEEMKLRMLQCAKGGTWYEGWQPYCMMCDYSGRMFKKDYGFQCPSCGNMIGWDLNRVAESPLNKVQNAQECDTTDDTQGTKAGNQK